MRQVVATEFTTTDAVTMSRHLRTRATCQYMTIAKLADLSDPARGEPEAANRQGRSAKVYLIEAIVRSGDARSFRQSLAPRHLVVEFD